MKLYDFPGAPNPRRVRIFAAEKGIELETVTVDLRGGEHKSAAFLTKNPSGKIPVLELDDGRCIGESIAYEIATIEMHHRHLELELFSQVGTSWVNGPVVAAMGRIEPIAAAKARSDQLVGAYYQRLNGELGSREYVAGNRFTVADITALCCIDFAASMVDLRPDDSLTELWRWHETISARPSVTD
jgi:glutathione S-transferase